MMRSLYDFVRDQYLVAAPLWRSCRYECWIMNSIVMLLGSDLSRPWSSTVTATDASLSGPGVCEATWSADDVRSVGEWRDAWRFVRLDPSEWAPRARAMGEMTEITDPHTAREHTGRCRDMWAPHEGFPEVPDRLLDASAWHITVYAGRFRFREHIGILEGRGHLWALRRLAKRPDMHEKRILCLIDNFGLSCALGKGRAMSYGLKQITRRLAALQLAMGSSVSSRWRPSEKNPADRPSRVFEGLEPAPRYAGPHERPWVAALRRADEWRRRAPAAGEAEERRGAHGWNPPPPSPAGLPHQALGLRASSGRKRDMPELRQALRGVRALAQGASRDDAPHLPPGRVGPPGVPGQLAEHRRRPHMAEKTIAAARGKHPALWRPRCPGCGGR